MSFRENGWPESRGDAGVDLEAGGCHSPLLLYYEGKKLILLRAKASDLFRITLEKTLSLLKSTKFRYMYYILFLRWLKKLFVEKNSFKRTSPRGKSSDAKRPF